MEDLQQDLQSRLHRSGQWFSIFDVDGNLLRSDAALQNAVASGLTPLAAACSDPIQENAQLQ
jgi:hypothetical protein